MTGEPKAPVASAILTAWQPARHGSSAVLGYIREAPLINAARFSGSTLQGLGVGYSAPARAAGGRELRRSGVK